MKCKECNHTYNNLTKEGLCAFCYQDKYGEWSKDFSNEGKGKKK
jgi:protein-arginine kinase activator protein McsA